MTVELSTADPRRLQAAIASVLSGELAPHARRPASLPPIERLEQGARDAVSDEIHDLDSADYFQSLLEVGYIVASADGLTESERATLAVFIHNATRSVLEEDLLRQHFSTLDVATDVLGRRERLCRAAEDFGDATSRREALGFATLVAVADGLLADAEMAVLTDLGSCFGMDESEVRLVIEDVVQALERALAEPQREPPVT